MKILYAIQGTGNGHISRARDIIPVLQQYGELDVLLSGTQADVDLGFSIRYQLHGLSFIFGKRGGVDFLKTIKSMKFFRLVSEIWSLNVRQYDLVINDFEPVSAWTCLLKAKKCVGLSHQSAVIHPFSPKPNKIDWIGYLILKYYAPVKNAYGFHFRTYADRINSPIIREEVRALETKEENYYTVYLPAYSDERIIHVLSNLDTDFKVFSKHSFKRRMEKNVEIIPIDNKLYLKSLSSCTGLICGAGFEGPSEALFLNKKLLVIPMKGQYEQQCNAVALEKLGVTVLNSLHLRHLKTLNKFIDQKEITPIDFPNETEKIIEKLIVENVELDYPVRADSFSLS
ncbi:glycosyltransferase family protein [Marivirga salinae]|uniref:Glycosyltransferase family protein n=1 Tax=Marivirga salinarum TaxID=3059078 RepID=A0AA49GC54_9BACT|nr:glycosyltransferase family protein [Marivirga sp. BDSF4-3]WKK75606.2 glycosyltransferase family protein [Marivirga sp. BDSF4-3]